ncbi:MAG: zinc ABC transporter substrate-binding protein [Anaerolineae bacterium]|nr:zinc ABC transporter substrate-binding protein [Anaerolineae bacterium]
MNKRFYIAATRLLLVAGVLAGCGQQTTPTVSAALHVTVSILPQRYFVERVGGEYVAVNVMVEPGASPATYEPQPEQLRALSLADVYFSIGVPFEDVWLERFASVNENLLLVDTTQGIERQGDPEHPDPHIWLSPALVKVQAQTIYETLAQLDPAHQETYRANLESFLTDIDALDADIRETLTGVENRKFMVFHPSWGYFARDYGLEQLPVEVEGQEPSAAELAALVARAKQEGIKVIFAQPEFSTRSAETLAQEIGGEVLLISPLAPDWLDNLRRVAEVLAKRMNK